MDTSQEQIIQLLKDHPDGLSILDVTSKLELNRNSIARYLDVLKSKGLVHERAIGPAKLYTYTGPLTYKYQVDLFKRAMDAASCGITIADAQTGDFPLIYANDEFLEITGYTREEILGKNCRFLQGTDRNQPVRTVIQNALQNNESCIVVIKNYTKNGTPFQNEVRLSPLKNADGVVTHYVGIQTPL